MESALIGLAGILIGILITEYFRKRNRIENYSHFIFGKRLDIYENLYNRLNAISNESTDIIENPQYSKEERLNKWSPIILDLAEYFDKNKLYIDENIIEHCMLTVAGVEEIHHIANKKVKTRAEKEFYKNINEATSMIKIETGLKEMDNLFKGITKAKHRSDYITELNSAREKYRKKKNL